MLNYFILSPHKNKINNSHSNCSKSCNPFNNIIPNKNMIAFNNHFNHDSLPLTSSTAFFKVSETKWLYLFVICVVIYINSTLTRNKKMLFIIIKIAKVLLNIISEKKDFKSNYLKRLKIKSWNLKNLLTTKTATI